MRPTGSSCSCASRCETGNSSSRYWAAVNHSATPPWLEQVPLRCCDFEYVPSLHLAVAPVGSVLLAFAVGADFVAVEVDFAAVVAGAEVAAWAGAAAAGAAAGA